MNHLDSGMELFVPDAISLSRPSGRAVVFKHEGFLDDPCVVAAIFPHDECEEAVDDGYGEAAVDVEGVLEGFVSEEGYNGGDDLLSSYGDS